VLFMAAAVKRGMIDEPAWCFAWPAAWESEMVKKKKRAVEAASSFPCLFFCLGAITLLIGRWPWPVNVAGERASKGPFPILPRKEGVDYGSPLLIGCFSPTRCLVR
jgi:hypothetical protein